MRSYPLVSAVPCRIFAASLVLSKIHRIRNLGHVRRMEVRQVGGLWMAGMVGMWELSWTDGWRLPSLPLEVTGWKMSHVLFGRADFQGATAMSVSGGDFWSFFFFSSIVARLHFDVCHCSSRYTLVPPPK